VLELTGNALWTRAVSVGAGETESAFENARAQLTFSVSSSGTGVAAAQLAGRDLDRILADEANPARRELLADAEARAAGALAPLIEARDAARARAAVALGLPGWPELIGRLHGRSPQQLAALAEATLAATDALADRAIAIAAPIGLGLPPDRVRREDLPRLVRTLAADAELPAERSWPIVRGSFAALGLDPLNLPADCGHLQVDAEPRATKVPRPLALLADPPGDVRLSVEPAGGLDQVRALLHETARALAGALSRPPRPELALLGDGTGQAALAWLADSLSGEPAWLRAQTPLRGASLDDVVHLEATRRLLQARRAAALVLFEVQRRAAPTSAEATAAIYGGWMRRATRALFSEVDTRRWPLETDGWLGPAFSLRAALLGAALAERWAAGAAASSTPATASAPGSPAWAPQDAGALFRRLGAGGKALTAEAAAAAEQVELSPAALASLIDRRLAYRAPDAPPQAQRPDYRYMQGDRRPRKKKPVQPRKRR
jgi:hypothetical protein